MKTKTTVAKTYEDGKVAVSEIVTADPAEMSMFDLMNQIAPDDGSKTEILAVGSVQEWKQ